MNRRALTWHSTPASGFYTTNSSYSSGSCLFLASRPSGCACSLLLLHRGSALEFESTEAACLIFRMHPGTYQEQAESQCAAFSGSYASDFLLKRDRQVKTSVPPRP